MGVNLEKLLKTVFIISLLFSTSFLFAYKIKKINTPNHQATLILSPVKNATRAVFYIHGFNDYVFNKELIDKFNKQGISFFGIDLHNYGRNINANTKYLYYFDNVDEFFDELKLSIEFIKNNYHIENLSILAHSQGGLIASLFVEKYPNIADNLILNSPFFDFYLPSYIEMLLTPIAFMGEHFPKYSLPQSEFSKYGLSINNQHLGEWDFNSSMKMIKPSPKIYLGWINAINKAFIKMRNGLNIKMPILVMYSSNSFAYANIDIKNKQNLKKLFSSDVVLDVQDIQKYSKYLGDDVMNLSIQGAMHDIFLSRKKVRDDGFLKMMKWIDEH